MGFRPKDTASLLAPTDKYDTDAIRIARELYAEEAKYTKDFTKAEMKTRYNGKHNPITFEKDDMVYIKL
jgi:hypothetical protein